MRAEEVEHRIREFRDQARRTKIMLKEIVEHPEITDSWTPAEKAWLLEHLEMIVHDSKALKDKIDAMLGESRG